MKPDSHQPAHDPELIEAEAAVWLSLRDRGLNESETAEFMRWMQEDPRHAEVFAALDATWQDFNRLAVARPEGAGEGDADLLAPRLRPQRRAPWILGGLAAAAALVLAVVGVWQDFSPRPTAETEIGGFRELRLADGSVVQLNTDSAVRTRFTAEERRIELLRGEAFFDVAANPARPFIVSAGGVAVRAVGTAFNVRLRETAVEVLVTEGKVQVNDSLKGGSLLGVDAAGTPSLLVQGEMAVIPASAVAGVPEAPTGNAGVVALVAPVEVQRALAWQERRLEFEARPLGEVVAEFNRYNRTKLVIADPRLGAQRFSGSFRAEGYEPFVRLLEQNFGVAAVREGDDIVLRRAQ
jgi:transmembrane sensor